jgi:cytochrome c-type biogenesis protein CcmH
MHDDIEPLRQQLRQLKALHEAGTLGDAAYEPARLQLEQRIVERVMSGAAPGPAGTGRSRLLTGGVVVLVLLVAVVGYRWTGSPTQAPPPVAADAAAPHPVAPEQMAAMVEQLAQRLKDNPADAEGWGMLARSYVVLGRHADALPAYKQALALNGDNDAVLLADYADALAVVNQRNLAGEPLALVKKALQIDPDNLKALSLAGTAAFDVKDYAGAVKHWERVVAVAPPGSPYVERVQASIAEARERGGLPPAAAPAAAAAAAIAGTVTLAAALRAQAGPEDTVFIFARPADGSRMPLAILRKQVKDLPFDFVLDDSLAMSPAAKLSSQRSVVVAARVSKGGSATPQPGDLSAQAPPVAVGTRGLKLEIATVVPKQP